MSEVLPRTSTPLVAGLVGGAFALVGALPMPYGYYGAMRFAVVAACVVLCFGAVFRQRPIVCAPLLIAAIFIAFVRGLPRDVWAVIDVVVGLGLVAIGAWLAGLPVRE
jgi:diacylglycerol kinase